MNLQAFLFLLFTLSIFNCANAQRYNAKIVDAQTSIPIPYVNLQYGKASGTITNEEGNFAFIIDSSVKRLDSVYISCLGYGRKGFTYNQILTDTIKLKPEAMELVGVDLFGTGLTGEEIIKKMKLLAPENYQSLPVQKRFFLRQSTTDSIFKAKLNLVSSSIPQINQFLLDSITKELPKTSKYYAETLGDMYKSGDNIKLLVNRGTELYNKENRATIDGLGNHLESIIKKHTKPDSYFKIKTGPISSKFNFNGQASQSNETNKVELQGLVQRDLVTKRKERLMLIELQVFGNKSRLDVISKSYRYSFKLQRTIKNKEGINQYMITFSPKKSASFDGTLYINSDDFALTRIEYTNKKPIKPLKLLGIDYKETEYSGVAVFSKMKNGKYALAFSKLNQNESLKLARPLKIVEKNKNTKGRRQQNEVELELYYSATNTHTFEWIAFERKGSSQHTFDKIPEDIYGEISYLTKYEPNFWKDYTILEPNQALKAFEVNSAN